MPENSPEAEVAIDAGLVRSLLREQHPDLHPLPLERFATGWDNELWALGDDLLVRLPRRELAASLVEHELRWLPELAPRLPLRVPTPLRRGEPSARYPWVWSVIPRLPGRTWLHTGVADELGAARALGEFVATLRGPAPDDMPHNPWRGVPLADRDARLRAAVRGLDPADAEGVTPGAVLAAWEDALGAPAWSGPPQWLHGDLHLANLLVDDGGLAAVVDWGDVTAGDPATDLGVAWMAFGPAARAAFREAADADDDALWRRGRGWALAIGLALVAGSADVPAMEQMGRRTVLAVLGDVLD